MLVAFSGGPDSVALALLLREIGYSVVLAYVNHNLRGSASDYEAQWVQAFAESEGFPLELLTLTRMDFSSQEGLQAQARALRYAWMERLMIEKNIPWGATAHTWDDQMETLLFRWVRGGLHWDWRGIPFRRGPWIRPLLFTTRAEVIAYLRSRGAAYLLDHTNYTPKYLRNQIRWYVLPPLYRLNPSLRQLWYEKVEIARYQRRHLMGLYKRWERRAFHPTPYGEVLTRPLPKDAFFIILRRRWKVDTSALKRLWSLWKNRKSGSMYLSGETTFVRTPTALQKGERTLWSPQWEPLEVPPAAMTLKWGIWHIETGMGEPPNDALIWDRTCLTFPLRVRLWQKGDRYAPFGMHGSTKKVSDVLQEMRWYGFERQHAFVVESADGEIVGVWGYRPSHHTAVSPSTVETFYLRARYGDAFPFGAVAP